jgi:hypothetical protein
MHSSGFFGIESGDHQSEPLTMDRIIAERIRNRAYALYLLRGVEGDPTADWLQAEKEVLSDMSGRRIGPANSYDARNNHGASRRWL